jgi:hypothetical protein
MTEIKFNILPDGGIVSLEEFELVIAGFTGKDVEKSKEHLRELEAQGIQTPSKIPVFYRAPMALATQNHWISVSNQMTSGEIEPVLVLSNGEYYISAGSDHTDRNMEKEDIARSKVACSKPLSSQAIPLKLAIEEWGSSELSSEVKSGSEWVLYQSGKTVDIRDPMELIALFKEENGKLPRNLVMFLGTIPLIGRKFIFGEEFRGTYTVQSSSESYKLAVEYKIEEGE